MDLHWLWHPLGVCPALPRYAWNACRSYNFWSGIGSDIGEISLITGLVALYWHRTCHVARCWRPAKHEVKGTPYKVCARHHPTVPDTVTVEHIQQSASAQLENTVRPGP